MPLNPRANINLSNNSIVNKKPPDNINENNKDYSDINNQDLTIAYNKVMGGSKEEVVLLDISGEDKDTQSNNLKVLTETHLEVFSEESSEEIKVMSLEEPIKY